VNSATGSQLSHAPLSIEHSNTAVGSSELRPKMALRLDVVARGPQSISVSGATVSMISHSKTAGTGS
jgi:hypothetical protein